MANHKSAKKRARQSLKRAARNRGYKTEVQNIIKRVRSAASANDPKKAKEALLLAVPIIDKAASRKVIKATTASRNISRLTRLVNKLGK